MIIKKAKWTIDKVILILAFGSFVLISFTFLLMDLLGHNVSMHFNTSALFLFFISTLSILFFSLQNNAFSFILSLSLTLAFSQRIVILYLFPDQLEFTSKLNFSVMDISNSLLFYSSSVLSLLVGCLLARFFPKICFSLTNKKVQEETVINFFFLRLKTEYFFNIIISTYVITLLLKFFVIVVYGIGLTGLIHTSDQSLYHWISSRSGTINGYALLSLIVMYNYGYQNRIRGVTILYVLENLVMASRSFLFSMIEIFASAYYLLGIRIKTKNIILSSIVVLLFAGLIYTAVTAIRGYLITGDLYFSNINPLFTISKGFGAFDELLLWMDMPANLYEKSIGFIPDMKLFINSFTIGEIFPMPEQVNLGKLMVAYGRNANFDIFALGGHAENAGAFATTYIYVGFFGGILYWFLLGLGMTLLVKSNLNLFWKYAFIVTFGYGPGYAFWVTFMGLIQPLALIGFVLLLHQIYKVILVFLN